MIGRTKRIPALARIATRWSVPDEPEARLRDVEEAWYFEQARTGRPTGAPCQSVASAWEENRLLFVE